MRLLPNEIYTMEPVIENTYNEIKHLIRPLSLYISGGSVNVYVSNDRINWYLADGSPFGAVDGNPAETISRTVIWEYLKYTVVDGSPTVVTTYNSTLRKAV